MIGAAGSLLSFLDTPVLVVDPEGHLAYVNPAFEQCFETTGQEAVGQPIAALFEGGAREAVLRAVAEVCRYGESLRFRVRERGTGFAATASPIVAADQRVGVVILMKEEVDGVERLIALHRELRDPLDELSGALETVAGEASDPAARARVEDALRALEGVRKWAERANAVICGAPPPDAALTDPGRLLRKVMRRLEGEFQQRAVDVALILPAALPFVRADARELEAILLRLVTERLESSGRGAGLTLSARRLPVDADGTGQVLLGISETGEGELPPLSPPALVKEVVAACGGAIHVATSPRAGRVTILRLPARST